MTTETLDIVLTGLDFNDLKLGPVSCTVGGIKHVAKIRLVQESKLIFTVQIDGLHCDLAGYFTPDLLDSSLLVCDMRQIKTDGTHTTKVRSGIARLFTRLGTMNSMSVLQVKQLLKARSIMVLRSFNAYQERLPKIDD